MDFGYPQYTEAMILSEFIKTDAYKLEVTQRPPMAVTNAVSWRNEGIYYKKNEVWPSFSFGYDDNFMSLISQVQHCNLHFFFYQVFLDVIESLNILINSNRQILRSEVVGALKMRACVRWLMIMVVMYLFNWDFSLTLTKTNVIFHSGMPECKLGLNDRVIMDAQSRATKGKSIDLEDIRFHQ